MRKTAKKDMGNGKKTEMVRFPGGVSKAKSEHPRYPYVVRWPGPDGKRLAKFFSNDTEALKWAKDKSGEAGQLGADFGTVGEDERAALAYWRAFHARNTPAPPPLLEVIQDYARRFESSQAGLTIAAAVESFLATKQAEGIGGPHLKGLGVRLGRFAREMGTRHLGTITTAEISDWILGLCGSEEPAERKRGRPPHAGPLSNQTRKNYRIALHGLFAWAKARKMIGENPVSDSAKPRPPKRLPGILKPADVSKFFGALVAKSPELVPFWALRAFAGIREAEAVRMTWNMVDLKAGTIILPATITKTGKPRTLEIKPALAALLAPHARKAGTIAPQTEMARRYALRKAMPAGFRPPSNWARHSFATYHMHAFRHPGETAMQLGHGGSPEMLHAHYAGVATEADALVFWAIRPETLPMPGNVIPMNESETETAPAAKPAKPKRKAAR